jgi:multiple sugar transport system ATP-binding protein
MAEIRLEHVFKRFGNVEVVKDINLDIRDGEFLVLVGPSGCGKTTILRMIAGLEEISAGNLYIGDRLVNNVEARDRDIAMVFQNYALYPNMTVYENMAFALKVHNVPRAEIEQRVTQAANMLELTPYLKRHPRELSGGQRQRVALARAIVRDPKAFLMDEPLSNLDAKLRVQTRAEISRLHQRLGRTMIYVTHDQTEAMTMGDRIAVLNAGVIQQLGTPQSLYDHPQNQFVAGFIGSPSMNFFPNTPVTREGGALHVSIGNQSIELTGDAATLLRGYAGRAVTLGVRPEDVLFTPDAPAGQALAGTVDVVEHLGNEQMLYANIEGQSLLARIGPSVRLTPGDKVMLVFDMSKVHAFDPATTKSLVDAVPVG